MTDSWANSGLDLHLDLHLDRTGVGRRSSLESALRHAISAGRLRPGDRLPASRQLSRDLGLARNTVADAYGQLVAEGWLDARQGSGTHVSAEVALLVDCVQPQVLVSPPPGISAPRLDLMATPPTVG